MSFLRALPALFRQILGLEEGGFPPRIATASAWGFAACALLVAFYHLPAGSWHRLLLLTFTPYLAVFGLAMSMLDPARTERWVTIGMLDSAAYLAIACVWAVGAWRRHEDAPTLQELRAARST